MCMTCTLTIQSAALISVGAICALHDLRFGIHIGNILELRLNRRRFVNSTDLSRPSPNSSLSGSYVIGSEFLFFQLRTGSRHVQCRDFRNIQIMLCFLQSLLSARTRTHCSEPQKPDTIWQFSSD